MIFDLSTAFIKGTKPNLLSDLVAQILNHKHYLTFSGEVVDYLWDVIGKHSSSTQTDLWLQSQENLSPTIEIKRYCTTVRDTTFSFEALMEMACKPAIILMENTREWVVYKRMIECYANDANYGNLYKMLERAAKDPARLLPVKSGGCGEMLQSLDDFFTEGYGLSLEQKVMVVFDRDTISAYSFDSNKKRLFKRLCGKKFSKLSNSDVYSLSQPGFIWHMWYRRELENYFPDSVFINSKFQRKVGLPPFEDNHYADVLEYYAPNKRTEKKLKNSFPLLSSYMTRELFEKNQMVFSIGEKHFGEIELFLLKIVKIV